MHIEIDSPEEKEISQALERKDDAGSKRMRRFLAMPDLTRTEDSPLQELVARILEIPILAKLDVIRAPEIVPADVSFDLFNFPADHPARSRSDTYYVDDTHVLRTHTTTMWYYYVNHPAVRARLEKGEAVGSLSYGKVYRKDEIDRRHMNIFHQMDGWYIAQRSKETITPDDLKSVLVQIVKAIFGPKTEYRFNDDSFPYTEPSFEMEVKMEGKDQWVEVLGSGMVHSSVLERLHIDSKEYHGWAFGFGLERLAILSMELPDIRLLWSEDERVKRQLKLGNKYEEVSKYPAITRDISFVVGRDFIPNNYFDLIRDLGGSLVEEVRLIDKYEDEQKFGKDRVSYTYRIGYRSTERTLVSSEVDVIQNEIYKETTKQFGAEVR